MLLLAFTFSAQGKSTSSLEADLRRHVKKSFQPCSNAPKKDMALLLESYKSFEAFELAAAGRATHSASCGVLPTPRCDEWKCALVFITGDCFDMTSIWDAIFSSKTAPKNDQILKETVEDAKNVSFDLFKDTAICAARA